MCKTDWGFNSGDGIANVVGIGGGEVRKNMEKGGSVDESIIIRQQVPFFVWEVCECVLKRRYMLFFIVSSSQKLWARCGFYLYDVQLPTIC